MDKDESILCSKNLRILLGVLCVHACMCTSTHVCVHMSAHVCVCMHARILAMCVSMSVCLYAHAHVWWISEQTYKH